MKFKKVSFSFLFLLIIFVPVNDNQAEEKKIVLKDDYYYVAYHDGKKISITSSRTGGAPNLEVVFSPDSEYVAYIAVNCLGFEGSGREICFMKVDGSERRVIYSSQYPIHDLNWLAFNHHQYLVFILDFYPMDVKGKVWIYDFEAKKMVFDTLGLRLNNLNDKTFLVCLDYMCREQGEYILDLSKISTRSYELDESRDISISEDSTRIFLGGEKDTILSGGLGHLLPECWPGGTYSDMVDVGTDIYWHFKNASLSPNCEFIAFSMKGRWSSFNGLFEIRTNKVYPLRFFVSKLTGNHYWSPNSKYVAYVDYPSDTQKLIDVFSVDSTLNLKDPLVTRTFRVERSDILDILYSQNSDTLYYTTRFFQLGREYTNNWSIYLGDK